MHKLVRASLSRFHHVVVRADHFKKSIDRLGQKKLGHISEEAEDPLLVVQFLVDRVEVAHIFPVEKSVLLELKFFKV